MVPSGAGAVPRSFVPLAVNKCLLRESNSSSNSSSQKAGTCWEKSTEASPGCFSLEMIPLWLGLGQALEIIRGCQGLNVVGCDLVEVSPPYDPSGE